MRNKLPAGLGVEGDEKLDVSLMPDEVKHWLLLLTVKWHTFRLAIEYQCDFWVTTQNSGRAVFLV